MKHYEFKDTCGKEDNSALLNNWLYKTILDNPRIATESTSAKEIYEKLADVFWIDCQKAFKKIAKEILKIEKN